MKVFESSLLFPHSFPQLLDSHSRVVAEQGAVISRVLWKLSKSKNVRYLGFSVLRRRWTSKVPYRSSMWYISTMWGSASSYSRNLLLAEQSSLGCGVSYVLVQSETSLTPFARGGLRRLQRQHSKGDAPDRGCRLLYELVRILVSPVDIFSVSSWSRVRHLPLR